jgi:hypothetical protein
MQQVTAADIIKRAMISVDACAPAAAGAAHHAGADELVLGVQAERVAEVSTPCAAHDGGAAPARAAQGGRGTRRNWDEARTNGPAQILFVVRVIGAGDGCAAGRAARHNARASSGTVKGSGL